MDYVLLLVGFVLLVKGADFFVEWSSSVAKLLKVPSVVIGLTIVAMGTSAPEAAVSIAAGFQGNNAIAISNVIGSNIFNLMVVVGFCAALKKFETESVIVKRDFPVNLAATVLVLVFMQDFCISLWEGVMLLLCLAAYLTVVVKDALKNRALVTAEQEEIKVLSPLRSLLFIVFGLAAVIFGGDLVVNKASAIALSWGLSQTFIGLTIVAMGTSLPELVTSLVAAKKGDSGLALGNVVGSNIFNLLFILGLSSTLHPIAITALSMFDIVILLGFTTLVFVRCVWKKNVNRLWGILFLCCYAAYMVYIVLR